MSKHILFLRPRDAACRIPARALSSTWFRLSQMPLLAKPRPVVRHYSIGKASSSLTQRHLVVMVKEPVAGRVKTRLARGIGDAHAVAFYRAVTNTTLSRLGISPRWRTYLGISPDAAVVSRAWPSRCGSQYVYRFAQGIGNLGQRMQRVFDGMPPGPVVIVGSDIPAITQRHIEQAFRSLGRSDAVVGPSPDGGYWLIGMRRVPRVLHAFAGVRWSSADTLGDTLQNLDGQRVAQVGVLADVDDVDDYKRIGAIAARRVLPLSVRELALAE